MIYPTITEYIEAIRFSEDNFDKLTNLVPVLKDNGEPYYSSGNFAVVFKMKDKETGKLHAVKCFLKDQEGREESYRKISNYLETIENRYLIKTQFLEKELFVDTKSTDQTEFPVVVMDWEEGVPLDVYIREKINDKMYLEYLCYTFSLMAQNLIEQEFAHGDLKPDNILVKEDGMLVLVDYDGMYVPEMFGERSRELGSPDFQHSDRKLIDFDKHLDDFSLASILLSLKLISIDPSLLDKFGDKDRLLFSREDYMNFYTSEINKVIVDYFENKEVYNLYCLFIQGLGRKMIVWGKEMWKLELEYYKKGFAIILNLSEFDDDAKALLGAHYMRGDGCGQDVPKGVEILFDLSYKNNMRAKNCLAVCYAKGYGVVEDLSKSVGWYKKSAEQGYARAQFRLGRCYFKGIGVVKDYTKAVEWVTKSAEQGFSEAQGRLGEMYTDGDGVPKDLAKSVEWYTKSAEQGNQKAQYALGLCYEKGNGVAKDLTKAVEWYTKSAEQGYARAQCNLGVCYYNGDGVAKNYEKAVELISKSAEQRYAIAQYILGICYENGNGVAKDLTKAVEWYSKSAGQGYARAQCNLGVCYENGYVVAKDLTKAVELYTKSAEQGNAVAQFKLGFCYYGCGVIEDFAKAVEWFTKSAEQGYPRAKCELGDCYQIGVGVDVDLTKAFQLFFESAELGYAGAQYKLGLCYENGKGVEKDLTKALEWYTKSAEQGNSLARNKLGLDSPPSLF